ncbi:MAG: chromate efflux transporter [Candidatus Bathyarchaeia archaeon]
MTRAASRKELAIYFLKLGLVAFGGPAAHIAMMEEETVRRKHWLSKEKFLDLLGAANLIPGPTSTETAIYIGYQQAGLIGLFIAGVCFILPAAVIVSVLAWVYVKYGSLPQVVGLLYGIKPIIIAVILQALWNLGRSAVKTRFLMICGISALALSVVGVSPLLVIFGIGSIVGVSRWLAEKRHDVKPRLISLCLLLLLPVLAFGVQVGGEYLEPSSSFGLWPLFVVFFKVGSIVFGSGYILLAFLQADLVARLHWITNSQLLDAITIGQVTPGPVFTTATFIGYLLGGPAGALVATVGIFAPGFILVMISGPLIPRIRNSSIAGAFLDGVIVASLALMASVTYILGRAAIIDFITAILTIASLILLIKFRVNSAWLVLLGATIGVLRVIV